MIRPDQVITKTDDRKIVRRISTGKLKEDADIDALYSIGTAQEFGEDVTVELHSL
ncbi:MAG: hypothetical protein HND51_11830 [Chloroflexi bacterium]|nr:hypothetical protein [Chloroflexota bacterium]